MVSLGFERSSLGHDIYTRNSNSGKLIAIVYVDDLIITGTGKELLAAFKTEMGKIFQMSDLGLLSYYLGIEVKHGADGITLCQSAYADKLLEKGVVWRLVTQASNPWKACLS
jgi:hypothetical protein